VEDGGKRRALGPQLSLSVSLTISEGPLPRRII